MDAILDLVALRYWSLQGARRHLSPTQYYDKEGRTGHTIGLLDVSPPGTGQRLAYVDPGRADRSFVKKTTRLTSRPNRSE